MRTSIGIAVRAPARTVFELARDVAAWPRMLPHYRSVTVRSHSDGTIVADMRAVRRFGPVPVPVGWRSRTWSETEDPDDLRLRFLHVAGATRGMNVTWHITPRSDGGCTVKIEHVFERHLPLLGPHGFPRAVDRLFVRPIAGKTLATFKRLAEAAPGATHPGRTLA